MMLTMLTVMIRRLIEAFRLVHVDGEGLWLVATFVRGVCARLHPCTPCFQHPRGPSPVHIYVYIPPPPAHTLEAYPLHTRWRPTPCAHPRGLRGMMLTMLTMMIRRLIEAFRLVHVDAELRAVGQRAILRNGPNQKQPSSHRSE